MARARVVKPEFFGDVVLAEVSVWARLLYIGLWQLMDRRGIMEYHPKTVKKDVFPYDDVTTAQIEAWVGELCAIGRLKSISVEGKLYLYAPTLTKHQHFHCNEKPNQLIPDSVLGACNPSQGSSNSDSGSVQAPGKHGASTVQAPDKNDACTADTDTDTDTDTDADAEKFAPLTQQQIKNLRKRFGFLVDKRLSDAIFRWENYDPFRKQKTPLITSVIRSLESERDKLAESEGLETKQSQTEKALKSWVPEFDVPVTGQ